VQALLLFIGNIPDFQIMLAPVALLFLSVAFKVSGQQAPVIPQPMEFTMGQMIVTLSCNFAFAGPNIPTLNQGFTRYEALVFQHSCTAGEDSLSGLTVSVDSTDENLTLETDESYMLLIGTQQAMLHAATVYGALHGLETFSQLVFYNFTSGVYQINNVPWNITDKPRFPHRGILIDTSRHFEPVQAVKRVLDAMSYAKFNVLHWHIVDSQSFPIQSITYPKLWNGAYTGQERFTAEDAKDVVEYARLRGVRVIPEFDMPGHAGSWCTGYPEICPAANCTQPLNPATNATFDLIEGLLKDMINIFSDQFIHLGGDEVDTSCWSKTPSVQAWMTMKNFTTSQAYMYFVERAHDIAHSVNRLPINWEEVFNEFGTKLDSQSIIQVWLNHATAAKIVAAGYRCILSNSDVWYLDHLTVTWKEFYANDPFEGITNVNQQKLMLGGEV
jgi:hexosaminidase